jgi:sterol desaturase/sphingolipid hydroxylase (fatty acid hydroxylase superfamily)
MQVVSKIIISFLILFIIFTILEKLFPAIRTKRVFREGFKLDLLYWVVAPTINAAIKNGSAIIVIILTATILGLKLDRDIVQGFGPIRQQPAGLVIVEMLLLGDFIGYWTHRWFHRQRLWKFHAIHHSSEDLDWLSSVRVHPLNQAISNSINVAVMLALGFPLMALAAYLPFILFYSIFLHANVSWSFGPFRYVIASPRFHRWHHTSEEQGLDKNFAGLFPIYDLIFGTFYIPRNKQPVQFGVLDKDLPNTLWGQLCYPFKRNSNEVQ